MLSGAHVGQVHVAAVVVRRQRVDRVDLGRAAQRADVRLVGQRDPLAPVHTVLVEVDLADLLGQRIVQRRGVVGTGQRTEVRDHAAGAAGVRAPRQHRLDVDRDGVALLGTLHHDRSVLRIQEGHVQLGGQAVLLGGDLALEGVARPDHDPVAGFHVQHRLRVRAHGVVIGALQGLGEVVRRADGAAGHAPLGHDRGVEPCHGRSPGGVVRRRGTCGRRRRPPTARAAPAPRCGPCPSRSSAAPWTGSCRCSARRTRRSGRALD